MKYVFVLSFVLTFSMLGAGTGRAGSDSPQLVPEFTGRPPKAEMPTGHPALPQQPKGEMVTGKVLETMDAGKYTYVRVKVGEEELWAAGLKTAVKVGDTVAFSKGMEMQSFRSETLNRTFDSIYFVDELHVGGIKTGGAAAATAAAAAGAGSGTAATNPHGSVAAGTPAGVDVSGIEPAEGGKTIKDIYEQKASLSGQDVVLRGKIVKANPGVMGKNWFHVRDGTAAADGKNDLTITSADVVAVGDTVLVHGKVVTDKDFGFGYKYDVMIEDAKIAKE